MATNEDFISAGSPDEMRAARLLIKQLQLDYGNSNVRVVDLRRAATPAAPAGVP